MNKKDREEDLGLVMGTKEESKWKILKDNLIDSMETAKRQQLVDEVTLELCEKMIKQEQK